MCILSCVQLFVTPWAVARQASVQGISQATILEWVAISFSRVFMTQGWNLGLLHCRQILYHCATWEGQGQPRLVF